MIKFEKVQAKKGVSFRLAPEILKTIDQIAKREKISRTLVVEKAIELLLKEYKR